MRELKKKKRWPKILATVGIVLAVLIGMIVVCGYGVRITEVEVEGNTVLTDEEVENYLFPSDLERRTLYCFLRELRGNRKTIPFVGSYRMDFQGLQSCKVTVYEKNIIGCLSYMGCYMYFDRDGMVVESSFSRLEGIPSIEGLRFDNVILGETLPVEDKRVFSTILNLTQQLEKYSIPIEEICFHSGSSLYVQIGAVKVELGGEEFMEEKLAKLSSIWKEMEGLEGTLYMDTYDGTENGNFIFKKNQ